MSVQTRMKICWFVLCLSVGMVIGSTYREGPARICDAKWQPIELGHNIHGWFKPCRDATTLERLTR